MSTNEAPECKTILQREIMWKYLHNKKLTNTSARKNS